MLRAGRVDKNPPHLLAGDGEKMSPVLPTHRVHIHQPEVDLVYQGSGLQRVAGIFPGHAAVGHAVEFVFNDRGQPFECLVVSAAPRFE